MKLGDTIFNRSQFNKVLPDIEEIVAIRITSKGEIGSYCVLLDYGNIEALLISSDVPRRSRRKPNWRFEKGAICAARLIRMDLESNYFDLSLRGISLEEEYQIIYPHRLSEITWFLFRQISRKLKLKKSFFGPIISNLERRFGNSYLGFLHYLSHPSEDLFSDIPLDPSIKQEIYFHIHALRNYSSQKISTPLFVAIQLGMVNCVKLLLKHGSDPNIGGEKISPLQLAFFTHQEEIIASLLENGASINILQGTLLRMAFAQNYVEVVRNMIKYDQSDINLLTLMQVYDYPTDIPELPSLAIREYCWKQRRNFIMFLYQYSFHCFSASYCCEKIFFYDLECSKVLVFQNSDLCRVIGSYL